MFETIADATRAVARAFYTGGLPQRALDALDPMVGAGQSPVLMVVTCAEAIYACRDDEDIDGAALDLGADCAQFSAQNGWHGMGLNARGELIAQILRDGRPLAADAVWPDIDPRFAVEAVPMGDGEGGDEEQPAPIIEQPELS